MAKLKIIYLNYNYLSGMGKYRFFGHFTDTDTDTIFEPKTDTFDQKMGPIPIPILFKN
jgi:hypothetical protein